MKKIILAILIISLFPSLTVNNAQDKNVDISANTLNTNTTDVKQKSGLCSYPLSSGWIVDGKSRGKLDLNFTYTPTPQAKVTHNVYLDYQWKRTIGGWGYNKFGPLSINGTWTLNIKRENSVNLTTLTDTYQCSYSKSFPSANSLKISINPKTGQSSPYPSQFTYTVPKGWVIQKIYLTNVNWNGSVPGGTHGINCNVNCQ